MHSGGRPGPFTPRCSLRHPHCLPRWAVVPGRTHLLRSYPRPVPAAWSPRARWRLPNCACAPGSAADYGGSRDRAQDPVRRECGPPASRPPGACVTFGTTATW
ncbi:hypothetical protein P7K49_035200 [Saguinus oedipus]|uniref:Uncharacterized protein n=1 Tax=Saguinus oedipus TaxID=9490 RepID=A0ABQ9TWW6_SAGOE|nr:hypothetical protein P7K49_035200 [Saguinus oedipus]